MLKSEFLPEICYKYKSLSLEDIFNAYADKQTVTGHVEKLLPEEKKVVVRLGDDIVAHMPYSEATIYPLRYSENLASPIPTNVFSLIGKNIRVKVTRLNGPFITVSRKANMLTAFEHTCKCDLATFHIVRIDRKCAFGDIGAGIIGRIIIDEVCRTHIKYITEYLHKNDVIQVRILERTEDNYFNASYRRACKPYNKDDYTVGMLVTGKVCDYVRDSKKPGFYVNIAPQVSGIMNVKSGQHHFRYGTMVECYVRNASEQGLHLEFSKMI